MWISHPDCKRLVIEAWNKHVQGCPMQIMSQKLKTVKGDLKIWNKLVFGDVNLKVDQCLEDLDTIQMQLASDGYSDDLHNKEAFAQIDLQQALNYQEQFWKDKSRLNWHLYGDRNTSFFFSQSH